MADNLADDEVQKALAVARQPSNLVTEADLYQPSISETLYDIGAALPSAVSNYVSSVPERFSAAKERISQMSPSEIAQSVGASAKSMFVDPAVQMFTAPGRAYQGQIPQEQMLPEALNFAGMATLGGIPASYAERAPGVMLGTSGSRMVPEAAAVELAKRELTPLGFYSHGAEAALALPQATGSVDQMIAMLRKQSGVTEAELRNAGLLTEDGRVNPDWLAKSKIGREDIASHLRSSMPQVEETVYGLKEPFDEERLGQLLTEYNSLKQHPIDDPSFGEDKYNELIRLMNIKDQSTTTNLYDRANDAIARGQRAQARGDKQLAESYFREAEFLNTRAEKLDLEGHGSQNPAKYEQYALPGGKNYREVVLHLPEQQKKLTEYQVLRPDGVADSRYMSIQDAARRALEINGTVSDPIESNIISGFKSQHFPNLNILAHIRMADRTGPNGEKILHVEEVQSDWGQKGKKEGFSSTADVNKFKIGEMPEFNSKYNGDFFDSWQLTAGNQNLGQIRKLKEGKKIKYVPSLVLREGVIKDHGKFDTYEEALNAVKNLEVFGHKQTHTTGNMPFDVEGINALYLNKDEALSGAKKHGLPSAPYVTSTSGWTDLAMKRILKEAAEGGYDKVVWTPGAEQAGRYDLSNQVDKLLHKKNPDGTYQVSAQIQGRGQMLGNGSLTEKELADHVGKEVAEKIINSEGKKVNLGGNSVSQPEDYWNELSGNGLKVGGEGMKEYYDKILPKRLQEVAKRHDKSAKVGYTEASGTGRYEVVLPNGKVIADYPDKVSADAIARNQKGAIVRTSNMSLPGLDITPQMRESILKGQGAFAEGGRTMGNNALGNALRMARDHFDYGGDVRGGDSPFMSRSDYGLRSVETPSFREAEDRSMREYNRAVESGWSPTSDRGGDGSRTPMQAQLDQTLSGRQSGFEGAPPVAMPSNIGELLGFNRARQNMMQSQQQQQETEQNEINQRIKDALSMASVGQTQFGDASALASGFPPVEKQQVIWGGGLRETPAWAANQAVELSRMPNVMGLPAGTALARTEMPVQAEYYGAPQETPEQMFARGDFGPQINAQFASAGSPYAVTPSAPQTMFAGTQPAFPHTPTPRPEPVALAQAAGTPTSSFNTASNVPLPPTVVRDPIAEAVAVASAPTFTMTAAPVEVAEVTDPLAQTPDALVLPGRKAAQTVPMPLARPTDLQSAGLFDKIRSDLDLATGQRINELEAAKQYAGGSPEQVAAALGVSPDALKARIINQDGKQVVDYYTKDLSEALFGDPLKALGAGIGSLFGAKTGDQQVADAVAAAREGGGDRNQRQTATAPVAAEAPKPPFMTELSEGNLALPHVDGLTAQQWANANTGGDLSKVHARIVYRDGAPRLEYYTV